MKIKHQLLLLAMILIGSVAGAQEKQRLTLQDAVKLSLANSDQMKLSNARVDEASAKLREARDHRLPDMGINGGYLRVNNPKVDLKVKLGGSSSSEQSGGGAQSAPKVDQVAYGLVNASVPIFSGFRINQGVKAASYLEQAASMDAKQDSNTVIEETMEAYSNAYKAGVALKLVQENLKKADSRVNDFVNLEKNGVVARNDLMKVQLQRSNIELAVLDAENHYKLASITLNLLLGLKEDVLVELDTNWFASSMTDAGYLNWENQALTNRSDLQANGMRGKAAEAGVKAAKGEYYPSLALTAGYVALYIPNFVTVSNAVNAGVGVKYSPSSLWKTGAKVAQAKARLAQLEASQGMLYDGIRLQVGHDYQNFLSLKKKIEVYNKALEQAGENYRIVKNKHDNNLSTTTDLLDADVAQLQAQIDYAFSRADAMIAYQKLRKTAGIINQ